MNSPDLVDLPPAPIDGSPAFVANLGDDLLIFGSTESRGRRVPTDQGAVLDAETFSWSTLPSPPFEFATGYLQAALSGRHLVISGHACDPETKPVGSAGPECSIGVEQTARLDLDAGVWTAVDDPGFDVSFTSTDKLFSVPNGVVAAVENERGIATWLRLDNDADTWETIAGPAITEPGVPVVQICGSGETVAVMATQTAVGGVGWEPTTLGGGGFGVRYGRAVVSFWIDDTATWSTPSEAAVPSGSTALQAGCIPGSFVVFAADGDDQGVWVLSDVPRTWSRAGLPQEVASTTRSVGPATVPLPVVGGTALALFGADLSTRWTFDVPALEWYPFEWRNLYELTPATLLGRSVATVQRSSVLQVLPAG
jgi:hypothetical protein